MRKPVAYLFTTYGTRNSRPFELNGWPKRSTNFEVKFNERDTKEKETRKIGEEGESESECERERDPRARVCVRVCVCGVGE